MNKNRIAVIIAILFTIVVLIGGWFYLQHIMEKYDIDKKDWNETASMIYDEKLPPGPHL